METETEPVDLEFMTTGDNNFTATEAVNSLKITTTTPTAKVTQTPCRTKTGALCKSWVYFEQTISG